MKKLLIALVTLLPSIAMAAGGSGVPLESADIDLHDTESLQRGLAFFQENCAGCHSTQYQRYSRVAEDLGISIDDMRNNYIFDEDTKVGDLMENAIPEADAAKWFGAVPPDLTLVARVRGEDWVYSYLKGFYADETRPFGVNNTVFPSVGMPDALEHLQRELSAEEFDQVARDITGFLVYSADPVRLERESLGKWVLAFLAVFFVLAYLLKKEYWKDVH